MRVEDQRLSERRRRNFDWIRERPRSDAATHDHLQLAIAVAAGRRLTHEQQVESTVGIEVRRHDVGDDEGRADGRRSGWCERVASAVPRPDGDRPLIRAEDEQIEQLIAIRIPDRRNHTVHPLQPERREIDLAK